MHVMHMARIGHISSANGEFFHNLSLPSQLDPSVRRSAPDYAFPKAV